MSSTYTRQRSSSMNSLNSNHSSYSTPQPAPINILLPPSNTLQLNVLPSLNTQQQPHQSLRHSASPGLVSSSTTNNNNNNNNNAFELPPPPQATHQSAPINPHANSISPTSTAANGASTTASINHKSDIISTPTLCSANINTIQNVAPTPSSTRSMSIVSLERSARNSIVSVDENLRYHARNDSSASLASLGHVNHNTFTMTPVGNSFGVQNRHDYGFDPGSGGGSGGGGGDTRMKSSHGVSCGSNQGSAVLTDDESEYDTNMSTSGGLSQSSDTLKTIPITPVLGATTSSMTFGLTTRGMARPMHRSKRRSFKDEVSLQHLKNDFKFKFHDMYTAAPTTIPTSPVSSHHSGCHIYSLNASPTSETLIHGGKQLQNESPLEDRNEFTSPGLNHDTIGKHLESSEMKNSTSTSSSSFTQPLAPTKKLKSTSLIQQSLYLKRKLAFSKDLQIEFNNASDLSNNNTTDVGSPGTSALHSHLITMSPPLSTALSEAKFFTHLPSSSTMMVPRRRLSSSLNDAESAKKTTSAGARGNADAGADLNSNANADSLVKLDLKMPIHDQDTSGASISPLTPLRAMQSVKEQNDLITKLNKKWNKAMINSSNSNNNSTDGSRDDNKTSNNDNLTNIDGQTQKHETTLSKLDETSVLHMVPNKRKRSRRDSFDVDEDDSFDDFSYDHYDK